MRKGSSVKEIHRSLAFDMLLHRLLRVLAAPFICTFYINVSILSLSIFVSCIQAIKSPWFYCFIVSLLRTSFFYLSKN